MEKETVTSESKTVNKIPTLSELSKDPSILWRRNPVTGQLEAFRKVVYSVSLDEVMRIPDAYLPEGSNALGVTHGGTKSSRTAGFYKNKDGS